MKQVVAAPNGLRWTVKRLIVPTGMRPMTRTDMLDAAAPRRTTVDGMSRQIPDAIIAPTGPLPLGFLLFPLMLPLLPLVLLMRRVRWLPWTIEARTHPWGRRYPPIVLTYAIRGGEETRLAFGQLVEALERGEGAPVTPALRRSLRRDSRTAARRRSSEAGPCGSTTSDSGAGVAVVGSG